jgi:hypothetical protein
MRSSIPLRLGLGLVPLLMCALPPTPAGAEETFAGAGSGVVERAAGEEREWLGFDARLFARLATLRVGGSVRVSRWPLEIAGRRPVRLTRYDPYAPDAKIFSVRADGTFEVPRSRLRFFTLLESGGPARGFVSFDPVEHTLYAMTQGAAGMMETRFDAERKTYRLASAEVRDAARPPEWQCSGEQHAADEPQWMNEAAEGLHGATGALPITRSLAAVSSLNLAKVDIDTDTEFMAMTRIGNDDPTAQNYIASLLGVINVMYERDLLVRLVQGTTFLRHVDTYVQGNGGGAANGNELNEVATNWNLNPPLEVVRRTVTAMLSGKSPDDTSASGIAYVSGLCSTSSGYSFSQVFHVSYMAGDSMVVGHEIGHNFGSLHTHCPNTSSPIEPIIDQCFSGELNCYSGPTSCPAAADYTGGSFTSTGTIMSYCHLLGGCISGTLPAGAGGGTTQMVFHPTTRLIINPKIAAALNTCIFPFFNTGVTPRTGGTAGGTAVTISGGGFVAGATVSFGGAAATGVSVVDGSTITATTPAHAVGLVNVTVTNPTTAAATLSSAYFYSDPTAGLQFFTLTPCRVADTRNATGTYGGPALAPNSTRVFPLNAQCGLPASGVKAVSLNVTAVQPAQSGEIALYPGNGVPTGTTTAAYDPGRTRANNIVVGLATDGAGTLGVQNLSQGTVHFIIDINGYYQ